MNRLSVEWYVFLTISFLFIAMNTHAAGLGVSGSDTSELEGTQFATSSSAHADQRRVYTAIGHHSLPQPLITRPLQVVLSPINASPDCEDTLLMDTTSYNHQSIQCPPDYVAIELDSTAFAPILPNPSSSQLYPTSQPKFTKPRYYLRCCKATVAYPS